MEARFESGPAPLFQERLRLPLIAAPMFLVSGVELIVAACSAGVIASFPTANCRTAGQLDDWLAEISQRLAAVRAATGRSTAPVCANLIVHKSNPRVEEDLQVLLRHDVELVITSVGSPDRVLRPLQEAGRKVFCDVSTLRHARRAAAQGVDGLVLLTAGAGGQTGWINPLAFVRAVREFWQGPLVLSGGISDGHALWAARALGCDFAYMGTKFIATEESMAPQAYKEMLLAAGPDDVLLTRAMTGLEANLLRPSLVAAGIDPDSLSAGHPQAATEFNADRYTDKPAPRTKAWKDVWSAGHSVSGVQAVLPIAELVHRTREEYEAARQLTSRLA